MIVNSEQLRHFEILLDGWEKDPENKALEKLIRNAMTMVAAEAPREELIEVGRFFISQNKRRRRECNEAN